MKSPSGCLAEALAKCLRPDKTLSDFISEQKKFKQLNFSEAKLEINTIWNKPLLVVIQQDSGLYKVMELEHSSMQFLLHKVCTELLRISLDEIC